MIREADQVAETIKTEAHRDAELVTRDARAEADRIRTDAQAKAEDARSQAETAVRAAREEADRTIAGLSTRRDALVDQLASMQERLIGVARDLESAMDVQVTIPDFSSIKDLRLEPDERDDPTAEEDAIRARSRRPAEAEADLETGTEASAVREPTIVVGEAEDVADDDGPSILDPSYEELWEGSDAMKLDIPALDLDWGDLDEGDEPVRTPERPLPAS